MKPSDKVVCIDDGPCLHCGCKIPVIKGQIYTVESAYEWNFDGRHYPCQGHFLVLVGVGAAPGHIRGIGANRFRLLSEVQMIVSAVKKHETYEPTFIP